MERIDSFALESVSMDLLLEGESGEGLFFFLALKGKDMHLICLLLTL